MIQLILNIQNREIHIQKVDLWLPRAEGCEDGEIRCVIANSIGVSCGA